MGIRTEVHIESDCQISEDLLFLLAPNFSREDRSEIKILNIFLCPNLLMNVCQFLK